VVDGDADVDGRCRRSGGRRTAGIDPARID